MFNGNEKEIESCGDPSSRREREREIVRVTNENFTRRGDKASSHDKTNLSLCFVLKIKKTFISPGQG